LEQQHFNAKHQAAQRQFGTAREAVSTLLKGFAD